MESGIVESESFTVELVCPECKRQWFYSDKGTPHIGDIACKLCKVSLRPLGTFRLWERARLT